MIERYRAACERAGCHIELVFLEDIFPCVRDGRPGVALCSGETAATPDFVICRTVAPALSRHLELCGARVFNSSAVSLLCNDKRRAYAAAAAAGAHVPDSFFLRGGRLPEDAAFPLVLKPAWGSGGRDIIMAASAEDAKKHMGALDWESWILQAPAPVLGRDLRVYVLGGKAICAVLRESDTDFRANFCLGGRAGVYELSQDERGIVEGLCSGFGFSLVGADFMFGADGSLIFNEFEDVVGARALYSLTDIDIAGLYVRHILDELGAG